MREGENQDLSFFKPASPPKLWYRWMLYLGVFFITGFIFLFGFKINQAQASACTISISSATNWSGSSWSGSGCTGGGSRYPGSAAGDSASITATASATLTLNVSPANELTSLTLNRPGTGVNLTLAIGSNSLTVDSYTCSATTPTSSAREDIVTISNGNFIINGSSAVGTTACIFTFTNAGLLKFNGAITGGPPALSAASTGTVEYASDSPTIQGFSTGAYYNLKFSGTGTSTANGAINFTHDLTNTGGGTLTFGSQAVTISGTNAQNVAGFSNTGAVSMTKTGGTATLAGDLSTTGTFTMNGSGGTLNIGTNTIEFGGAFTNTAGTLVASSGTVIYDRSGTQTCANIQYNNLQFGGTSTKTCNSFTSPIWGDVTVGGTATWAPTATFTINGDITVNSGTFTDSGALTVQGNLTVNGGAFTTGGVVLNLNGFTEVSGGTLSFTNNTAVKTFANLLTVDGGTVSGSSTNIVLTNGVNVTSGSFASTGTVKIQGNITQSGGTFAPTGTITLDTNDLSLDGTLSFATLKANTSGKNVTNNGDVSVSGTLTLTGNWIQGPGSSLTMTSTTPFSGAGTLDANNYTNTVIYGGTSQTIQAVSYDNLTLSCSTACTLPASDLTLEGNLVVDANSPVTKSASHTLIFANGSSQTITDNNSTKQDLGKIQVSSSGSGFSYYRAVTIDHTKVPNTDQESFPVLINGTYSYLATTSHGGDVHNSSGYDIGFYSNNSCSWGKMNWETEKYTSTTGAVIYWVSVPKVSSSADTTIYLCYGNSGISTNQSNAAGVWGSHYGGVWHLGDSSSPAVDSNNANNATQSGGVSFNTSAVVGNGIGLVAASSQYLNAGAGASLVLTGAMTAEAWVYVNSIANGSEDVIINNGAVATNQFQYSFEIEINGPLCLYWNNASNDPALCSDVSEVSLHQWTHLTAVRYTMNTGQMYINGSPVPTTFFPATDSTIPASGQGSAIIGKAGDSTSSYMNGDIDELRLSSNARTGDWIATEYANMNSPSTFYSVGGSATSVTIPTTLSLGADAEFTTFTIDASQTFTHTSNSLTVTGALSDNGTISGSGSGTITGNGDITGTGTINLSGGTVEQRVGASQNFGGTGSINWIFNNLTFSNSNSASHTVTTQSDTGTITVNGQMLIGKSGDNSLAPTVLAAGNRTWNLTATGTPLTLLASPAASITQNTSTFNYDPASSSTVTVAGAAYHILTLNSSSTTFTASGNITADSTVNITAGTFDQGASYNLTTGGTLTVGVSGGWSNTGTGDITLGGNVSNSGTVMIESNNSTSCSGTKDIVIASSDGATQRTWSGSGSFTIYNVSASYQAGSITVHNSTDVGHNGWTFNTSGCSVISGTIYGTNETSTINSGPSIKLSINAATASTVSANGSGVFTFTLDPPSTGDIITVWISGDGSHQGSLVFRYGSSCTGNPDCTGLKIFQNEVIVSSYDGSALTNTNLAGCDDDTGTGCNTTDLGFTSNSGNLAVDSGFTLRIKDSSASFAPGGDVTADTFKQSSGTFTGGSGSLTFGSFNESGGAFTSTSGTMTINPDTDTTVTVFTFSGGTFTHNSGTVDFYNGAQCSGFVINMSLSQDITFYNLYEDINAACGPDYLALTGGSTGQVNVAGTLTQHNGSDAVSANLTGNLVIDAGATGGGANIVFNGSGAQTYAYASGGNGPDLFINKSSGTVTAAGGTTDLEISLLEIDQGSFTAPSGSLTFNDPNQDNPLVYTILDVASGATFTPNSGTIVFAMHDNACGTGPVYTIDVATTLTVNNVTFNNEYDCIQDVVATASGDTLILTGNMLIENNGDVSGIYQVQGNLTDNATASSDAAITLTGSNSQTISGTATLPTGLLTISKTNSTDTVTLAGNVALGGGLTVTKGIFSQGAAYNLTTAGTLTVSTNGTWTDTGTGGVTLGGDVSNSGIITINSDNGVQCTDGANDILIASTSGGVQRNWSGSGTFNLYNLDVTDMTDSAIHAYKSVFHNTTWSVGSCGGTTVSGTIYGTDESTTINSGPTINVSVNGGTAVSGTANGSGVFTIITSTTPAAGDPVTIWISGDGSHNGTLVFRYGNSCTSNPDCTGLKIYQNEIILSSYDGAAITNANLAACDNDTGTGCNTTDIGFTSNSGTLTLASGRTLNIPTGTTFSPGGNVSAPNVKIIGTYDNATSNPNLTLTGNLTINSGGAYTKGTGTAVFNGGTTETITDSNSTKQDLGNVQVSAGGSATTVNLGSSVKVSSVTIDSSQTLSSNGSNTLTTTGNFTNNGIFTPSTGTVDFEPAAQTASVISGTGTLSFYNFTSNAVGATLQFEANVTTTIANTLTLAGTSQSNQVHLDSATPGQQWQITLSNAPASVNYIVVSNSACVTSYAIGSNNGSLVNGGNNGICWIFVSYYAPVSIDGGSGGGTPQGGGGSSGGSGGTDGGSGGGGGVLPQAFTAANSTSLTSYDSNWTVLTGNFAINTNAVYSNAASANTLARWTAGSFNNDQYAEMTLTPLASGAYIGVAVRTQNGAASGYIAYSDSNTAVKIILLNAGSPTTLYTGTAIDAGDTIRLEIQGNSLTLKDNGSVVTTVSDSTFASGLPGLSGYGNSTGSRGDNWNAGSIISDNGGGGGGSP